MNEKNPADVGIVLKKTPSTESNTMEKESDKSKEKEHIEKTKLSLEEIKYEETDNRVVEVKPNSKGKLMSEEEILDLKKKSSKKFEQVESMKEIKPYNQKNNDEQVEVEESIKDVDNKNQNILSESKITSSLSSKKIPILGSNSSKNSLFPDSKNTNESNQRLSTLRSNGESTKKETSIQNSYPIDKSGKNTNHSSNSYTKIKKDAKFVKKMSNTPKNLIQKSHTIKSSSDIKETKSQKSKIIKDEELIEANNHETMELYDTKEHSSYKRISITRLYKPKPIQMSPKRNKSINLDYQKLKTNTNSDQTLFILKSKESKSFSSMINLREDIDPISKLKPEDLDKKKSINLLQNSSNEDFQQIYKNQEMLLSREPLSMNKHNQIEKLKLNYGKNQFLFSTRCELS